MAVGLILIMLFISMLSCLIILKVSVKYKNNEGNYIFNYQLINIRKI